MQCCITGCLVASATFTLAGIALAQPKNTIYDEAQVDATTSSSTSRSACTSPGEDTKTRIMRTVSDMVAALELRG